MIKIDDTDLLGYHPDIRRRLIRFVAEYVVVLEMSQHTLPFIVKRRRLKGTRKPLILTQRH
jgi:hypothetical protein